MSAASSPSESSGKRKCPDSTADSPAPAALPAAAPAPTEAKRAKLDAASAEKALARIQEAAFYALGVDADDEDESTMTYTLQWILAVTAATTGSRVQELYSEYRGQLVEAAAEECDPWPDSVRNGKKWYSKCLQPGYVPNFFV